MFAELSKELAKLTASVSDRLIHIGAPGITGRTGIIWEKNLAVTLAKQAEDGETITVILWDGKKVSAQVKAHDVRQGLTLLTGDFSGTIWNLGKAPATGSLALTVAFPSPAGLEARLEMVRFSDMENKGFQTDSLPYPGFSCAPVMDPEGNLLGIVSENASGNHSWVTGIAEVNRIVEELKSEGSRRRVYLGINTKPVVLNDQQKAAAGKNTGLLVLEVAKNSPAALAELGIGDILLSIGKIELESSGQLWEHLFELRIGKTEVVKLLRGSEVVTMSLTPKGR